ncbi:MAG: MFS transporter [Candidatus Lokiarchaeota archaeon]|nr:MFS transporter [Candidatus Lokiarchaeota archaeon]
MSETELDTGSKHPWWRYASNSSFQITATVIGATQAIYLYYFYFNVLGLEPGLIVLALTIFTIYDAINDPIIGFLVDRNTRLTKRWGRRFPWIVIGIVPWTLSLFLIFTAPTVNPANPWPVFFWLFGSLILMDTFGTLVGINVSALRPDLFRTEKERQKLTWWWTPLDMIAQALGFILPPLFINPSALKASYGLMGTMMSIICLISAVLFLPGTTETKVVKERYFTGKYESFSFFSGMKEVLKSKSFIVFFITLTAFNMTINLLMGNAPFVNTFLLRYAAGDEIIIFVIFMVGAFIAFPFWILYLKKIKNNKKVLAIGGLALGITLFPLSFFQTEIDLYIMLFILGVAMGSMWAFFYTIIQASVIDDFVASTRKNQKGILLGVSTLLGRLVATLDEGVMALVHTTTGFPAGSEDYAGLVTAVNAAGGDVNLVLLGIRLLFGIIPSIVIIVGTFVFWKYFPLTQDKVLENKRILEELGF